MTAKYELTGETKDGLRRIRALRDIPRWWVKAGDLGGWVESESNLSHDGDCWVSGTARVSGAARVSGDAWVFGAALVSGDAWVSGDARVSGTAWVYGTAWVSGTAEVSGDAQVSGSARVYGTARVSGDADWLAVGPVGSESRTVTICRRQGDGSVLVTAGCWSGTAAELRERVASAKVRWPDAAKADRRRWARQYRAVADLADTMAVTA